LGPVIKEDVMNKGKDTDAEVQRQTYISGGVRLELIATKVADGEWTLSVLNQRGVFSTWLEYFESPDAAFCVGLETLQDEGIEEFTSIEGFEYLDEFRPSLS
jgi:hypothetical protein